MVAEAAAGTPHGPRGVLVGVSGNVIPRLRRIAVTTPGRLGIAMVGLIVLSLLAGVVGLVTAQGKANTLDNLAGQREPVSAAAQQIYRSLSDADATAASAFLAGAIESDQTRARYQTDLRQAGAALAVAAADSAGVADAGQPLNTLATDIPTYTGLVEKATANNQLGFPVGSAYLREADSLMQTQLLPAAQQLYGVDTGRLAAEQDDATSFPWLAVLLVIVLLVALVIAQRYLTRRTNRVVNVGLVVATGAVVVGLLWSSTALILESVYVAHGRSAGSAPVQLLTQARITALQARTDETLNLVARGGQDYETPFNAAAKQLGGTDGSGGLLGQVRGSAQDSAMVGQVNTASTATGSWLALNKKVSQANGNGEYDTAVNISLGVDPNNNESAAFDRVDKALDAALQQGRKDFIEQTDTAANWLIALPIGLLVLSVIAAAGATVGIWQRLREYR